MKKKSFEELVKPSESGTTEDMRINFTKDGNIYFYTHGIKDKEGTAKRFLDLCLILINNPEMIYHAFELCDKDEVNKENWIKKAIRKIKKHPRRY